MTTSKNYDFITAENAEIILQTLCEENSEIRKRTKELAIKLLSKIDVEEITDEVYYALDFIEVEDLWNRSGADHYGGYNDPADMAIEMFEETIEPFVKKLSEYQKNSMPNEEKLYCMGILQGIYRFDKESKSQYREWAEDVAGEVFNWVYKEWATRNKDSVYLEDMKKFIQTNCSGW